MRKAERIALAKLNYGLSLYLCEAHNMPLVHHLDDFGEGCWDCPAEGCDYHIHQFRQMEWDLPS